MLRGFFTIFGFPDPFSTSPWSSNGPIAMLPGVQMGSGLPGSGIGSQRLGDLTFTQGTNPVALPGNDVNPSWAGVDRARSTVPGYVHTYYWTGNGGSGSRPAAAGINSTTTNPYLKEYGCREANYLGAAAKNVKWYNNKTAVESAWPSCQ